MVNINEKKYVYKNISNSCCNVNISLDKWSGNFYDRKI